MSRADPSGLCFTAGPYCPGAHGGGGFTSISPVLTGRHFQWRYHFTTVVYWVLGGFGGWPWDGGHGAGFLVPAISFFIGGELESVPRSRAVSLSQEATPADGRMSSPLPPWLAFTPGEAASIGIGFIPVFGTAASVYEVATGRDLFTGEEVHRGMAMIGVVPGGKLIRAAGNRASAAKPIGEYGPRGGRLTLRQPMINQHGRSRRT